MTNRFRDESLFERIDVVGAGNVGVVHFVDDAGHGERFRPINALNCRVCFCTQNQRQVQLTYM